MNKLLKAAKQCSLYLQDINTKGQDSFKMVEAIKLLELVIIPQLEQDSQKDEEKEVS